MKPIASLHIKVPDTQEVVLNDSVGERDELPRLLINLLPFLRAASVDSPPVLYEHWHVCNSQPNQIVPHRSDPRDVEGIGPGNSVATGVSKAGLARRLDVGPPDSGSKTMRKPTKDPIREDRIHNEAIVDAYGSEEKAMSWYYYLENKIHFPFSAKCIVASLVSPFKKGETVEVRRLAPEDACSRDMLVLIRWQNRNMAVPLSQLAPVDPDETTAEAIGDWHYWVARGYLF
jgi:hypothetical protein